MNTLRLIFIHPIDWFEFHDETNLFVAQTMLTNVWPRDSKNGDPISDPILISISIMSKIKALLEEITLHI